MLGLTDGDKFSRLRDWQFARGEAGHYSAVNLFARNGKATRERRVLGWLACPIHLSSIALTRERVQRGIVRCESDLNPAIILALTP